MKNKIEKVIAKIDPIVRPTLDVSVYYSTHELRDNRLIPDMTGWQVALEAEINFYDAEKDEDINIAKLSLYCFSFSNLEDGEAFNVLDAYSQDAFTMYEAIKKYIKNTKNYKLGEKTNVCELGSLDISPDFKDKEISASVIHLIPTLIKDYLNLSGQTYICIFPCDVPAGESLPDEFKFVKGIELYVTTAAMLAKGSPRREKMMHLV